ncbi:hypothetical protein EDB81DRAFT_145882 [Dactylonectria macrodidyma]|uniref:Uncharacterized protein n=1 Tax=Dactylonectria macrodidyma TaxID=307937 RepID=A0A9P9DZ49_9HYPO|nr:hypothetical protein EDB81DRAFT_145882 [Dactylonectria macrodidyma]
MGYPVRDLQPGTLYLTISTTHAPERDTGVAHDYHSSLPNTLDPSIYETSCAQGYGNEEFQWGLYWHRGLGDGTWFMLHRLLFIPPGVIPGVTHPMYMLDQQEMSQSPRLFAHVVGLVRVLRVPETSTSDLTSYLNWLAPQAAMQANRSFMWASSVYVRTRRHVAKMQGLVDRAAEGFDITVLLYESLNFAYGEVWYGLSRQLPRPIMVSDAGITMVSAEKDLDRDRPKNTPWVKVQ